MDAASIKAAIAAKFEADRLHRLAFEGVDCYTDHVYCFISPQDMARVENATGARSRMSGSGATAMRLLDYEGCVFQCSAGRAD